VTAGGDKTAKVCDARRGVEIITVLGPTGEVASASFSPDGMRVVTAAHDSLGKVWDARTGQNSVCLQPRAGTVSYVSFSPDGSRV
jgi:WD40 repeat protein